MRTCIKCKQDKDETEFHKDNSRLSGCAPKCKVCVKAYYEEHREVMLQRAKDWILAHPERHNENCKRSKKKRKEAKEKIDE